MNTFLGIDGGGSKTDFLLVDDTGRVLGEHRDGPAYHPETGLPQVQDLIATGIHRTAEGSGIAPRDITYTFIGLPGYGEDSALRGPLDTIASPLLAQDRYRCDNDMVCGWAGALGCRDGINVVSGTGSIAYGEFNGCRARVGGWGELFSDEGSAYWVAREGLALFARMSDERAPRGPLYEHVRRHFKLESDLDLCAALYGSGAPLRSQIAGLATVIAEAASQGDESARSIFTRAAEELVGLVEATRVRLRPPEGALLPVSYSGGMFRLRHLMLDGLEQGLARAAHSFRLVPPRLPPNAGAAIYAAKTCGHPLSETALATLAAQLQDRRASMGP